VSTFLAWVICIGIIGIILFALFAQVWDESAEIAREEQRKADWREVNRWKQKALRPVARIQILDNICRKDGETYIVQKGGEIFIREDLRKER
jgi:hypothetical protein